MVSVGNMNIYVNVVTWYMGISAYKIVIQKCVLSLINTDEHASYFLIAFLILRSQYAELDHSKFRCILVAYHFNAWWLCTLLDNFSKLNINGKLSVSNHS